MPLSLCTNWDPEYKCYLYRNDDATIPTRLLGSSGRWFIYVHADDRHVAGLPTAIGSAATTTTTVFKHGSGARRPDAFYPDLCHLAAFIQRIFFDQFQQHLRVLLIYYQQEFSLFDLYIGIDTWWCWTHL